MHSNDAALFLAQVAAETTAQALSQPRPEGAGTLNVIVGLSREMANALECEPRLIFPAPVPRVKG